jgi:sulfur transfer protein SufE
MLNKSDLGDSERTNSCAELLPLSQRISLADGWDNQYRQLLLASKALPILPIAFRLPDNAVFGCESELWIKVEGNQIWAYSQSKVIRGILAVLIEKAIDLLASQDNMNNDSKARKVAAEFNYFDYLSTLKLTPYFSAGRRDGIQNVISTLRQKLA